MTSNLRARFANGAAFPAVLLFVIASHAVLATVFVPVHSDVDVYKRYAASVAKGIQDGTSFSVAHDDIVREEARRRDLPQPATDRLLIEYPPLAVTWMAAVGAGLDLGAGTSSDAYDPRYRLAMLMVDLLVLLVLVGWAARGLVASSQGDRMSASRLAVYGVAGLILGNLMFDRLDLVLGALLLLSVLLLVRGSWMAAFLVLALAINFKASPIALAPLWVVASLPSHLFARARTRPGPLLAAMAARTIALAVLTFMLFLPFLFTEGGRALDFLHFRAVQGVHIESVPGAILLALHEIGLPLEVSYTFGTYEVQTPLSPALAAVSPLLLLVAAAVTLLAYVRRATTWPGRHVPASNGDDPATQVDDISLAVSKPPIFLTAALATLLLTLATSKLLSPQYLIWLLPLVPLLDIGPARTRAFHLWFLGTCVVTTAIFPYLLGRTLARRDPASDGFLDPTPLGVGLLLLRNGLLIWLAWLALSPLLQRRPGTGNRG